MLYNEHAGKWIMTYLDENLDIVLRSADSPEGPWSASQAISTFADHPGLYGGFLHPSSTGDDLYLAMTQWDPYNVYLVRASIDEDANLARPNLVQDPSFERATTADLSSSWGCLAPCGADNSHAWGMAGNKNAWLRYNSGSARPVPDHRGGAGHGVRAEDVAADGWRDRSRLLRRAGDG